MSEKYTLTSDSKGRLCITAEWNDEKKNDGVPPIRNAESVLLADIHPSRMTYIGMVEAMPIFHKGDGSWAENMKTPLNIYAGSKESETK